MYLGRVQFTMINRWPLQSNDIVDGKIEKKMVEVNFKCVWLPECNKDLIQCFVNEWTQTACYSTQIVDTPPDIVLPLNHTIMYMRLSF